MIIGLAGKKKVGKNAIGDYLVANEGFIDMSFAEPIRQALELMGFPEPMDHAEREKAIKGIEKSWRQLAQTLATDWGRDTIHSDIWVYSLIQRMQFANEAGTSIVITDVRFENEAKMIREIGGKIWHIERPGLPHDPHISEQGIEKLPEDMMILNDRGIALLLDEVAQLI